MRDFPPVFESFRRGLTCCRFIPRTVSRSNRIDPAVCRRKCPAEGWMDGFCCTERRPGEQNEEEKKRKSAGLLNTVSEFFCWTRSVCLKVKMLRHVSRRAALPFTSRLLNGRCCSFSGACPCTGSRCHGAGHSRPARDALTLLSLMRTHALLLCGCVWAGFQPDAHALPPSPPPPRPLA